MCQPYSKLKLRCAFKADWPDWDIDEDSFSRWADLDIDCPLLVTMMKEHETDLIERGDFDPDEWGTDETTLFDGVHLHIDGGHIVYHQPDWGADIEFTNVPKTIGEAFDNFIDTFWEEFPDTDTDELEELLRKRQGQAHRGYEQLHMVVWRLRLAIGCSVLERGGRPCIFPGHVPTRPGSCRGHRGVAHGPC